MNVKEHEKFIAFMALLISLMIVVLLLRFWPMADTPANSGMLQLMNLIVGALIGGFGAAVQKLLQADVVKIDNKPNEPVPTTDTPAPSVDQEPAPVEGLPSYAQ